MTDRRRLIVMRHAKAEPFASSDHERPLTDRGRLDAREAGAHLREQGLLPDHVLVSSAARAQQTWHAVADGMQEPDGEVSVDEALFAGGADVVLEAMRMVPEDSRTVLFVGHNPTAAYLCHLLDDGAGDPAALAGLLQGFPPAALAVLELEVPWADLGEQTGRVVDYHVGRG